MPFLGNINSIKKSLIIATALACTLFSGSVVAREIQVVALKIDGLLQKDGQGLYDQVFAAVNQISGNDLTMRVVAPARSFQEFESGAAACILPANVNPDFYDFSFETVQSEPWFVAKVYLFTAAGSEPVSDLSALVGKKVGIRSGMPYGNNVESAGLNLVNARTIEANIKKLAAGRIDAFLAYYPDVYAVFETVGMEPLPHVVYEPIAVHEDALLCRKDMGGEAIVAKFNAALKKLEENGALARILE